MQAGHGSGSYVDEEECLPFPIFFAELELLCGKSNRGKPNGVQLLELLQKLVAIIPRTDKLVLKQHQRQCEDMLYDVLAHGIGSAVRRLIYSCITSLYTYGDSLSLYTRASSLLAYLSSKEGMSRSTAESIRVGLLDFLSHLHVQHGRMLGNSAQESVAIAVRTVSKSGNQTAVRCAALRLATAVVRGLNPLDRSALTVHSDAWSIVQRNVKDRTSEEVRAGCLELLCALCSVGGGPLWREGAHTAEEALRISLALSEDPTQAVRDAAFRAIGELAAASRSSAAAEALSGEKRPAKKAAAERILGGCVRGCLVTPLVESAVHGRREACLGMSGAWMAYIASLPRHREGHDHTLDLMDVAALLVTAVSEAGRIAAEARSSPDGSTAELGAGLAAGGELPPLQATALYVLRRGVMASLAEAGQRKLVERLADTLDKRLVTPAAVVTLEALATLLEAVGEVTDETAATLERLLQPYVFSSSAATRQQAAITLAALAVAYPAGAARVLEGCLDTIAVCARQLAAPLTPAASASSDTLTAATRGEMNLATVSQPSTPLSPTGGGAAVGGATQPAAASPSRPATPTGAAAATGVAARALSQRSAMDSCHGAALSAARLLLATARAPLGCPARLQRRALALVEDLVTGPGPEVAANRAICREVGFLLLGSLCTLRVPQATRGPEEMAALWQTALGESARQELDERSYLAPGGDLDLAVQLWWRSVALQALTAYVAASQAAPGIGSGAALSRSGGGAFRGGFSVPSVQPSFGSGASFSVRYDSGVAAGRTGSAGSELGAMVGPEGDQQDMASVLAPLIAPLLELLDSQAYLQDPARAKGGPGGVIAGAAATFTLCLLELHLRMPGGRLVASSTHIGILVKTSLRLFRVGLAPGAADALTRCALRGLLSADDAPLGPWPTGADPHEDALRAYTGGRGAPHLPPWVTAEEQAAMLTGVPPSATSGVPTSGSGPAASGSEYETMDGGLSGGNGGAGMAVNGSAVALGGGAVSSPGASEATGMAHATYPQPVGLEAALNTAQIVLLGRLLGSSPVAQQLQMLDVVLGAVQSAKSLARQSRDAAACRRLPLGVAAAVAALAAYGPAAMAARKTKAPLDPSDKVPEKLLQLAQAVMPDDNAAAPDAAPLARAAAELFAASAATGSDAWALRVVRSLASELSASAAEGRDSQRRAVVALALGGAHRARGGLAMQGAVAGSVDALVAAASRPGCSAAAAWVLHSLWLVACGGGGAFVARVKTSLQLAQELLVSSFESPALRAACARLANAAVATLGPEFTLGSLAYARAKSLVAASGGDQATGAPEVGVTAGEATAARPGGGADGGLGMVLFVQQIILFAPHAVPPAKHAPLLLEHLLARQPDLRAASALTLRHLAERSAGALQPEEAAPLLFAALDAEGDAHIAGHLRATLDTILVASASAQPSFWLSLLSDVVFAVGAPQASATADADAADGQRGGDDEDDDKYGQAPAAAAAASAAAKPASGQGESAKAVRTVREVLTAPHLRTRQFAAECLLRLVRVCVASDEQHRDSSALDWQGTSRAATANTAGASGQRDLLIAKLQVLVDIGFKLATCPLESLRPHGVRMLTLLVRLFGDVPDPLLQGARLMEQYQAQVVSALRSSLGARPAAAGLVPSFGSSGPEGTGSAAAAGAAGSPTVAPNPQLQIAGGVLATTFLESGLAAGDTVVMRRLMELLSAPLSAWHTLRYEAYAEWVGARARVELLRAHAQCSNIAAAAAARGDALCSGIVAKAHEPHAARLQALWGQLLQDHAVLSSQPDEVLAAYSSPLLYGAAGLSPRASSPSDGIDGASAASAAGFAAVRGGDADAEVAGLTPALAAVMRPLYAAACSAALGALTSSLPSAAQFLAGPAARAQFRRLLEVGLMLLTDAAARLAHAVHAAVADAPGSAKGRAHANGGGTVPTALAGGFTDVRSAANHLAAVLQALQRLLAAAYVSAIIAPGDTSAAADGEHPTASDEAAEPAAAPEGASLEEQLVPATVLIDVLRTLGAIGAHALVPLQWALLSGVAPPSLNGLLPSLALPCCAIVREVCGAAPEDCLGLAIVASNDEGALLQRRQSSLSAGPRDSGIPHSQSVDAHDDGLSNGDGSSATGPATIVTAGVEAILLLASVCSPYACSSTFQEDGSVNGTPVWLQPTLGRRRSSGGYGSSAGALGCAPLLVPALEIAPSLAQCTVQLLAAAQLLIRRAPWPALEHNVGPLLELPLRLMVTSQPGAPVVLASTRYLDNAIAALTARAAPSSTLPAPTAASGSSVADSAAAYAAAASTAVADAASLHLQALSARHRDGAAAGAVGDGDGADTALLQGRFASLVTALISSAAALPAEQQSSPAPTHTNSGRSLLGARPSRLSSAGSGRSLRIGPVHASRSPSSNAPAASSAAANGNRGDDAASGQAASPTAARTCATSVLASALAHGSPTAAARAVLEAVRTFVADAASEDAAAARGRWARSLVGTLAPVMVERASALLVSAKQPLAGEEQSLVAECLKILVLAATLAGSHGAPAQEGVMQVLVPLLVELAAPAVGSSAATPALRDMGIKLITSLPASAAGGAFKTHLAAQPAAAKLRLQGALREAATASAAAGSGAASSGSGTDAAQQHGAAAPAPAAAASPVAARRPAIQLKTTFALPLPGK